MSALTDDEPTFRLVGICHKCVHLRPGMGGRVCTAYPGGIPPAILRGDHDHHKPYPGDKGIQFKQRP